jgi:glutathione synthase/RimK-type ligase-like ATP-grasp enzyme
MIKKILIVTNSQDLHADLIVKIIKRKGYDCFRINLDHFPKDYQINQQFLNGQLTGEITYIPSGNRININEISSVWMRKFAEFSYVSSNLTKQESAFAQQETEQAAFGFLYSLNCFWMSHPISMRGAMFKGEQLNRALKMGFEIPDSLVTNIPNSVKAFNEKTEVDTIYKTMSSPVLAADGVKTNEVISTGIPTTIITDEMLGDLDSVKELPCHFQTYIEKQYELRVTVIGQNIFSAKIDSQADEKTRIDCRDMSAEINYSSIELPEAFKQQCLDFVASYGLNYSALDFIVTPSGKFVFLENNPNGQFLYVEQLVPELEMLDAVANTLIKEGKCHN